METGRKQQARKRSSASWFSSMGLFKMATLGLISFSLLNIVWYEMTRNKKSNYTSNFDGISRTFLSRGKIEERQTTTAKVWRPHHKLPRRFFAYSNGSSFYAEPGSTSENMEGYGVFESIPRYPYEVEDMIVMNATDPNVVTHIQQTMQKRLSALLNSDATVEFSNDGKITSLPLFLPPQFPQHDRSLSTGLLNATFIGFPPTCCPLKKLEDGSLVENKEVDCTCRSPTNYPADGLWPKVTLVTAFYQFSSKHNANDYKRYFRQIMQSSDPIVIFLEPGSEWITYFKEQRQHAPTMIIPWSMNNMICANVFSIDEFWKDQHSRLDPERNRFHKGVDMNLFAIWCEKVIFVEAVARLNPFNTSSFAWIDCGIARNPMPHLWRRSIVNANISNSGVVKEHAVLFNQVWNYNFNETLAYRPISPDSFVIVVGGNMFAGTVQAFSNLYSAFYDVMWSMALEDIFVGNDQCVVYRTCHTYPSACHIHSGRHMYQWNSFIKEDEVLNGINKISAPLQLVPIEPRPRILPVPPLRITIANLPTMASNEVE